jgi:hypothetical protein
MYSFNYEAAVCGGIPIIHSLQSDFFADDISKVMGIMNGTTNFMLCKMEDEKASYADALSQAQALGSFHYVAISFYYILFKSFKKNVKKNGILIWIYCFVRVC